MYIIKRTDIKSDVCIFNGDDCTMIGIGKWKFNINTFFFKGDVYLTIEDNNGKYKFTPEFPGYDGKLVYTLEEVNENGNSLYVRGSSAMVPAVKSVAATFFFEGDKCRFVSDLPFIGHIEVKNGIKVA